MATQKQIPPQRASVYTPTTATRPQPYGSTIGGTYEQPSAPRPSLQTNDMPTYGHSPSETGDIYNRYAVTPFMLNRSGLAGGAAMTDYGIGMAGAGAGIVGGAVDAAYADRGAAYDMASRGQVIGASGMTSQDAQINALIDQSQARTPSAAEAQLRMAQGQISNQMMAQAASARGGNRAAAMRNAQDAASQNALITNQQAALVRAQEEAVRQRNILDAREFAAASYGDRSKMGYGMEGAGIGYAGASTGRVGDFGSTIGGIGADVAKTGVGQQDVYMGAIRDQESGVRADKAREDEQKNENRWRNWAAIGAGAETAGKVAASASTMAGGM